jgi:heterotetrameric sarcosine oxidase gamma subunit
LSHLFSLIRKGHDFMRDCQLSPRAPFTDAPFSASSASGVLVSGRDGLGIATIRPRKGRVAALAQLTRTRFGIDLPAGPKRTAAGGIAFASMGPAAWLATCEQGGNAFAASLEEALGYSASITDQSDGYAVLLMTGPKVRDVLARLLPLDLHPRSFKQDDVASTVAAHMGVILWRLADASDGSPVFELAVFRSFAASFWRALSINGAPAIRCA